jgi:branched-subunit amino acid transport protein
VSAVWVAVLLVGSATVLLKAVGPVFFGGRPLPGRVSGVVSLLAPSLLAALVVTQVVGSDRELVADARLLGLAGAAAALALRAPLLAVVAVAALVTALARLLL